VSEINGSDHDEKDRFGKTPLALVAMENTPDVEAVLIANGADPNLISDF
jgi:ankyrin repeat protein